MNKGELHLGPMFCHPATFRICEKIGFESGAPVLKTGLPNFCQDQLLDVLLPTGWKDSEEEVTKHLSRCLVPLPTSSRYMSMSVEEPAFQGGAFETKLFFL